MTSSPTFQRYLVAGHARCRRRSSPTADGFLAVDQRDRWAAQPGHQTWLRRRHQEPSTSSSPMSEWAAPRQRTSSGGRGARGSARIHLQPAWPSGGLHRFRRVLPSGAVRGVKLGNRRTRFSTPATRSPVRGRHDLAQSALRCSRRWVVASPPAQNSRRFVRGLAGRTPAFSRHAGHRAGAAARKIHAWN